MAVVVKWLKRGTIAALVLVSLPALTGSGRDLDYVANTRRFVGGFFPPDLSVISEVMRSFVETFQIGFMATILGASIALPLAVAGAAKIAPAPLVQATRLFLAAIRTVPSLIWALVAVAIVGPNPWAGTIALTLYSLGYLGKFFSDGLDSMNHDVPRTLRDLGAHPVQAFQYGLWSESKPILLSHTLWMLEYNLRSAAIIGFVGAGGVGVHLHTYQEYGQWHKFSTVLILIFFVVIGLDVLGQRLRKRLVPQPQ